MRTGRQLGSVVVGRRTRDQTATGAAMAPGGVSGGARGVARVLVHGLPAVSGTRRVVRSPHAIGRASMDFS